MVGLVLTTVSCKCSYKMNGEGIVNTIEGKPGARSPNFHGGREKKVCGMNERDLNTTQQTS